MATRIAPAPMSIIAREETGNAVDYSIQSGEHVYIARLVNGEACGCNRTTGEACPAWYYRHSCKHMTLAVQNEQGRGSDVQQHLQDEQVYSCYQCGARLKNHDGYCAGCAAA